MDASYKIQRGIHVHLIQFFMCPEFWVHIIISRRTLRLFFWIWDRAVSACCQFRRLLLKTQEPIRLNLTNGCSRQPNMITGLLRRTAQRRFASTARKPLRHGSINMCCRIPRSKHSAFQRCIFKRISIFCESR